MNAFLPASWYKKPIKKWITTVIVNDVPSQVLGYPFVNDMVKWLITNPSPRVKEGTKQLSAKQIEQKKLIDIWMITQSENKWALSPKSITVGPRR